MSPDERELLSGLFDRIRGAANTPRDQDAETLIQDGTRSQPYAPYFLAQTVLVQDQALQAANSRLQELEGKVRELESTAANQPRAGGFLSGLGTLFGGSGSALSQRGPAPSAGSRSSQPQRQGGWQQPPAYPPPPGSAPGPWGGQGGGFLTGALGTAAGVAGGVLLADSIRSLFTGHNNNLGIGTGFGGASPGLGGDTITNNYYGTSDPNLAQQDAAQDSQQDAADNWQYAQDKQQDANQDQDDIQDASDYAGGYDSGDDGTYDT
ncbi:MAG: DUF2076 domain-containing protein [Beijerinckiaceae bacterium]|nr:DUF2076 domain-containing protein [Beijerinckiaceae bacterium]MCI0736202.1 DUF2076 domain-containing protein [Beijerinckiaceae bacterium]